ncbi:hypothetical protein [Nonomuraea sp. MG754425]|uniref:hypothetical protein n=1 Tax=Nonomuraea sp. MG754425 TaxID=2570319 RepID=UPI001F47ABE8|nr:hypothetical protein [Nonomuraea sp. MG754425]
MSARRDLGPDFEDAVVESFLDKMGQEIDRRVDERLAEAAPKARRPARSATSEGQRLALAIVSLALGTIATVLFVVMGPDQMIGLIPVWAGIIIVNGIYNGSRKD